MSKTSTGYLRLVFLLAALGLAGQPRQHTSLPQNIPSQLPGHNAILMGTDWYPEQWPEPVWKKDVSLMEASHLHVVRIAEFAWSSMEPSEGRFDFSWIERAIRLLERHHIAVVLGTPTATPPAWLTHKYPETLRMEPNGQRVAHGNRAHGSVTSPKYLYLCRRIVEEMAKRFGHDPNVVGWQIDNEYGYALMSYDDETKRQFQDWLKAKYKALDALNQHWATAYWSQAYDDWSEIPIPVGAHNPALMLEWKRFVSYAWARYQQNQIDVIRGHADTRQFTTGNFMGIGWDGVDHYSMSLPLTLVSWDDYVGSGHLDPFANGMSHDGMRGMKGQNFWVMETQPGAVNWAGTNNFLNKGEVRAMAWHAIGHGADDVNYWQWRSALNGQEELHGTLVGPDGEPVPLLDEVARTAGEFEQAQSAFRGTRVVSEVAILNDYDSRWALEFQKHTNQYNASTVTLGYYRALRKITQSLDVIGPYAPLTGYKLVVATNLNVLPEALAKRLTEYIKNGGHLVLGPRSGMKDEYNALLPQRQPGFLVEALGGRVEQYYALEKNVPITGTWGGGEASVWAEQLKQAAPDTEVLLRYGASNGWLDGQPAVLTRSYGKGRITYIGAILDDKLMAAAAGWMTQRTGVHAAFGVVPDGIEVNRRIGEDTQVFVLINFAQQKQKIALPRPMKSVLDGSQATSLELGVYGIAVLLDAK
ncbi:MAG TPA: beta-galactosidase [Candidatus Angelobacter sp.]|nr:beta-galactosidase [Candidatus Angelobacter sp.]